MLLKGNTVIGLKVISLQEGKELESVKDIVYDPIANEIRALLIDEGGWLSDARVILMKDVHNIGEDAVIIPSTDYIKRASDVPHRVAAIAKGDQYLTKTKIVTEYGKELGLVTDIHFDTKTGKVSEIEVSQGLLKNMQSGTKRVKVADILTIGEDTTIVKSYIEEKFEKQGEQKGAQGSVNATRQQAASLMDQVKQKTQEFTQKTQDRVRDVKEDQQIQHMIDQVKDETKKTQQQLQEEVQAIKQNPKTQETLDTVKQQTQKAKEAIQEETQKAQQAIQQTKQYKKKQHRPHARTGYPTPTSGDYRPIGALGGQGKIHLKKGKTTPPNRRGANQAFELVQKTKHKK